MRPISPSALALLQSTDPQLVRQIDALASQNRSGGANAPVEVVFSHFDDDFMRLYAALWYASTKQVAVTILPAPTTKRPKSDHSVS